MLVLSKVYNQTVIELERQVEKIIYNSLMNNQNFLSMDSHITKNGYQYDDLYLSINKDKTYKLESVALSDNKLQVNIFRIIPKGRTQYREVKIERYFTIDNNNESFYSTIKEFVAECLRR